MTRTKDDLWYNKVVNAYNEIKYECKNCGHKQLILPHREKEICDICGRYVFKNNKDEFKFRFKEALKK